MIPKFIQKNGLVRLMNGGFRLLRFFAQLTVLVSLFTASASASDLDLIIERAWLEDSKGQLQWHELEGRAVQPFEGVLSRGFGPSTLWLRLKIDPGPKAQNPTLNEPLILRIRPLYLDNIQVFDALAGGLVGVTGDRQHPKLQTLAGLDFMLAIERGDAPRYVWLRLKSTSTRQISVQALPLKSIQMVIQKQQMVFAFYMAVIFIFMIWGAVHWSFSGEGVVGAFSLQQAAALVFAFCSLGYARFLWPVDWPAGWLDDMTTVSGLIAVSSAIFFHLILIRELNSPSWPVLVLRVMLALLPVKLTMVGLGYPMGAAALNMLEIMMAPMIFLWAVWASKAWVAVPGRVPPILPRWVVIGFYVLLLMLLAVATFPGLGLSQGGEIPLYLVQAHGLVTAFLMLLLLQYRSYLMRKQQQETSLELERSQILVLQESKIREDQSKLLAMLAHELRTPLSTMHMRLDSKAPGSDVIRQAIRDMDAVIERCVQANRLSDKRLKPNRSRVELVGLVHKGINEISHSDRVQFLSPPTLWIRTDHQLLCIVIKNLLENAIKYSELESPIRVELGTVTAVDSDYQQIKFEVMNKPGPAGWPDADNVFEKYYRSPHARRQVGTGLGLFLVCKLVRVLGGQIEYRPDATHVRFTVLIPV